MLKTFLHKHMSMLMTHVQDGRLRAHPLVLVEPATLRASTSMSRLSTTSVMRPNDRCPPAASPRSSTLLLRSLVRDRPLVEDPNHDLSGGRTHEPPNAFAPALPPVSAHVCYITVQGARSASSRGRSPAPMGEPGKGGYWYMIRGNALRHSRQVPQHITATPRAAIGT